MLTDEKRAYFEWVDSVMQRPDAEAFIEEIEKRRVATGITAQDAYEWRKERNAREAAEVKF